MKVRQIKRNVNRKKPAKFTFAASVFFGGTWQRFKTTFWTRTMDYKIYAKVNGSDEKMFITNLNVMRKGKPLSLKGL